MILLSCLSSFSFAQQKELPLSSPPEIEYPGIIQTFESLIEIDKNKINELRKKIPENNDELKDSKKVLNLELQVDFLNSIILHSKSAYVKMASSDRCRMYDAILTDLLKSSEGKISQVFINYTTRSGQKQTAILSKKDFLTNVVNQECPQTTKLVEQFQIKILDQTLNSIQFEIPTNIDQCRISHLGWQKNAKTPYLCQIYEYLEEVNKNEGDPKTLKQRKAVGKVLESKLTNHQKDYIENLCENLDDEQSYCDNFLKISFWSKIADQQKDKIYLEDICKNINKKNKLNEVDYKICLNRIKSEQDLCLYGKENNHHLSPNLDCDSLSIALNHSSLKSNYNDCPGVNDQMASNLFSRIFFNINNSEPKEYSGPCSVISSGEVVKFNEKFNNDEAWTLKACYFDKIKEREICSNTFFGEYENHPYSLTKVIANILKETKGASESLKCSMIDNSEYNPLLLEYKNGCHIIYEKLKCLQSECKFKIVFNDREIKDINIQGRNLLDFYPSSIKNERFSIHYLLKNDFKQSIIQISNLTFATSFFNKSKKGVLYGVGCAEDLLPSFFKSNYLNQCSPVPFIVDGIVKNESEISFVTRTSLDSLQTPRLIQWSQIFSGVKSYQKFHPLKIWSLHGIN